MFQVQTVTGMFVPFFFSQIMARLNDAGKELDKKKAPGERGKRRALVLLPKGSPQTEGQPWR